MIFNWDRIKFTERALISHTIMSDTAENNIQQINDHWFLVFGTFFMANRNQVQFKPIQMPFKCQAQTFSQKKGIQLDFKNRSNTTQVAIKSVT